MDRCILLNADGTYLTMLDWKKAMCLLCKGAAKVIKYTNRIVRTVTEEYKVPLVMMLVKLVRTKWKKSVPYSKQNVILRDNNTCQYCGVKGTLTNKLTVDHMIPKSRDGKSVFENTIASCKQCNNIKGDRTPSESKMFPKKQPTQPTIGEFINKKMKILGIDKILEEVYKDTL